MVGEERDEPDFGNGSSVVGSELVCLRLEYESPQERSREPVGSDGRNPGQRQPRVGDPRLASGRGDSSLRGGRMTMDRRKFTTAGACAGLSALAADRLLDVASIADRRK